MPVVDPLPLPLSVCLLSVCRGGLFLARQPLSFASQYMHSKGICHADMSLENTLVNMERTQAFIIDFGMALQMPTDDLGRRCDIYK